MLIKSVILWDVRPCSLVECYQSYGGIDFLNQQGWRVSQLSGKHNKDDDDDNDNDAAGYNDDR
jgi:hypothetical protein